MTLVKSLHSAYLKIFDYPVLEMSDFYRGIKYLRKPSIPKLYPELKDNIIWALTDYSEAGRVDM